MEYYHIIQRRNIVLVGQDVEYVACSVDDEATDEEHFHFLVRRPIRRSTKPFRRDNFRASYWRTAPDGCSQTHKTVQACTECGDFITINAIDSAEHLERTIAYCIEKADRSFSEAQTAKRLAKKRVASANRRLPNYRFPSFSVAGADEESSSSGTDEEASYGKRLREDDC